MSLSRMSAGLAVLALVAASVFGGAVSASAEPTAPVITLPVSGPDPDAQPTVEGNVSEDGLTVTVTVTNGGVPSTYCVDPGATIALGFSCTGAVPLAYGMTDFTATATYTSGIPDSLDSLPSTTVNYEHYGLQPVLFTTVPAANTTDATPAFAGTGPSLGTVEVREGISLLCTSVVDASGNWACNSTPLALGLHTSINTRGIDRASGVTNDFALDFTVDSPPAPTVDQLFTPWDTSAATRDVQGNKDADVSYIQVYRSPNGIDTWTAYCQTSGNIMVATVWLCDPPFGTLAAGPNYLAAVGFNENSDASVTGPSALITRVPSPTITAPANGILTNDSTPTFSGTATGTSATVYDSGAASTICSGPIVVGNYSCNAPPLSDGTYSYFVYATPGDEVFSAPRTLTIDTVAPSAPVITSPNTTTDTHPVISGTAEPFATVILYRDGAPASCQEGAIVANAGGQWSCTSVAILPPGNSYGYGAKQVDGAGNPSTPGVPGIQLTLTVLVAPAPTPTPEPPQPWTFSFGVDGTDFEPGDSTTLSGSNLPPGAAVRAEFQSVPVEVGATSVGADGTFSLRVTVPVDALAGPHHFAVTITPTTGLPSTQRQAVTVRMPPRAAADSPAKELQSSILFSPGGDRNEPAAPSALTHAIKTTQWVFDHPVMIGTAAVAGLALLLLVAFPAELLNSTVSEQYERFKRRVHRVRAPWWRRFSAWLTSTPLLGGLSMTIVAAVVFGFADPGFGFDLTSLRVVLACAIALFVVGYLASAIAGAIIRHRWRLNTVMELMPLGLILTVVGVVLSRLLEFSPGFLIGLILGLSLAGTTTVAERAKATLVQAAVVFSLAMLGWVGYSILATTMSPDSFGTALAFDTLVAITSEGLVALFIGLLPLKYLSGEGLFEYSKVVWAACYVLATAAFLLIVVPNSWSDFGGSLGLWITVLGGFAVLAVGIYLYFRFWAPPLEKAADEDAGPIREDART